MKVNEKVYGFRVNSSEYVKEVDGTLYDCRHEASGARLLFLDRHDENKTFAIGFKTIPTDDTGVFHIMEHSVLCGSRKFPVKDPFTEMIKGSVSTYINALTSGDKTVYPVSSKNDKAFLGLVEVYLDAVLHPLALENPYIFMQEGHRYELDEDGNLTITGVVYNEMKGAYSTVDDYADALIARQLSPGGTYSYDSGGHPDFIPELTYENFKAAHEKFYHPSNSCIFLDGEVKLDEILPLIDSYLSEYKSRECHIEIDNGGSTVTEPLITSYPIEKEVDPKDKTRVFVCHNTYPHSERYKTSALSLASEALADSNNAPLTKRILDTGLCESFTLLPTRSYSLNSLNATFIGVKDGKERELIEAFNCAISDILKSGIPRENLIAALGRREFNTREADFGTYPTGMVYMGGCIEAALFGESPAECLKYEDMLSFLREKLDTGYYEELLSEVVFSPAATLILHPDNGLDERKEAELREKLDHILDGMSKEERAALSETGKDFALWQSTPDSEAALASIPSLSIEDLKRDPKKIPTEVFVENGCEIISHSIHTSGITYPEIFFDASDVPTDELGYIRLFTDLMSEWDTEYGSVTDFRNRVKKHLGAFYISPYPTKKGDDVKLYITLKLSCLESNKDVALELVHEHLFKTLFNNKELLAKNIRQIYTYSTENIVSKGDVFATMRDAAKHSPFEALTEALFGYEYHSFLKNLTENTEEKAESILKRFKMIRDKYFRRERLTVGITEQNGLEFAKRIVGLIPTGGTKPGACTVTALKAVNEGIAAPSTVSFAARIGNLNEIGENLYTGALSLLSHMVSYEILWNEIRLKMGAYDTGFVARANSGSVGCYSYCDPSPNDSVSFFGHVSDEIDTLLSGSPDLLKYKIGVIGSADTVSTPRNDGWGETARYLSGKTHVDKVKTRRECLDATLSDLKKLSEIIRKAMSNSTFTVIGPRDVLERIDGINSILDI